MDTLYGLLKESTQLYKNVLDLEYKKYDAIIKADITTLDDIVSKEQACYLKMRGIDQRRELLLEKIGFKNKTLKEIIELSDGDQKVLLQEAYNELHVVLKEVKRINSLCKTLIEVRLHRVDKAMSQLGEKKNTYAQSTDKQNTKSLILSKRI